jgi:hypothetical protein
MAKSETTSKELRVALNPRNPEANSWYDPATGVNLFLNSPESADWGAVPSSSLEAIKRGIKAGLLIVSRGELPDGVLAADINQFASPRSRWGEEHSDTQHAAVANWNKLLASKTAE